VLNSIVFQDLALIPFVIQVCAKPEKEVSRGGAEAQERTETAWLTQRHRATERTAKGFLCGFQFLLWPLCELFSVVLSLRLCASA
jgi:hypothetical protein